ncbi:hypothetical protein ACHFCA_07455 [Delftia tsuruhatensis]
MPATPAPAEPPKPKPAPAPVAPIAEPSFIDTLMEDPTIPLAGAALLALLLGYGGYRVMQRRRAAAASSESAFGDSQLAADSFFGASGGQRVDTGTSSQLSGTSMHYSPSQLDAGDVDPVAEADVYLAYGRDLQAEEILKEALRTDPSRTALHQKLADIYAKRHDRKAFEAVAQTLHGLTQGKGVDWQRLADQGRILDPENALYQPAGAAPCLLPPLPAAPQRQLPDWRPPRWPAAPWTWRRTAKALPPCPWTWTWTSTWTCPAAWPTPACPRSTPARCPHRPPCPANRTSLRWSPRCAHHWSPCSQQQARRLAWIPAWSRLLHRWTCPASSPRPTPR